jgi:predicted dehydrogenase
VNDPVEAQTARVVPLMRDSPGFRSALDAIAEFRRPECVNICFGAGSGESTLFARLFDASDVLHALCGEAEGIAASLAGALGVVPESLGRLHGHLTANLRFTDTTSACLSVSDRAGSWFRMVTLVGEAGMLRITDGDCAWTDASGEPVDTGRSERSFSPGELIGMQIARLLDRRDPGAVAPPRDVPNLLAMCEAARVSCRTGQVEAPQRMLQMLGNA